MDREAIKQAVRDAADHQVACATMGYDLRGVHLLMEVAVEYLRITASPDDDRAWWWRGHQSIVVGLDGGWCGVEVDGERKIVPLSECWPTREQSLVPPQIGDDKPQATDPLPVTLAALHHSREALDRAIAAVEKLTEGRKDWQ